MADSYDFRRAFPSRVRPWCRKSAKNRYDARIISSSSFLTKPSYGGFPRGVLVGLIPKFGRESTEKSSNYDTTCVMNRPSYHLACSLSSLSVRETN